MKKTKKKRSKLEIMSPVVRLDRDPTLDSLALKMTMVSTRKRSPVQKKERTLDNKTSTCPLSKTRIKIQNDSSSTSTLLSSPCGDQCVVCHRNLTVTTLQEGQFDTFVRFVEHFKFEPQFAALFEGSKPRGLIADPEKSCQDCAETVDKIWELDAVIETAQRQIRNSISHLVRKMQVWKKGEDDEDAVGNSNTGEGQQRIDEGVVKAESEDEEDCELSCVTSDCLEFDLDVDGIGIDSPGSICISTSGRVGTPAVDQSFVDSQVEVRRSLRSRIPKRKFDDTEEEAEFEADVGNPFKSQSPSRESKSVISSNYTSSIISETSPAMENQGTDRKCNICGTQLLSLTSLTRHLRDVHHYKKPTPCPHCDIFTRDPRSLKKHIKYRHRNKLSTGVREKLTCSVCGKGFPFISNRMAHEINWCKMPYDEERLKKEKVRLFRCPETGCAWVFSEMKELKEHVCIQPGENRPFFSCRFHCGTKFVHRKGKRRHERINVCKKGAETDTAYAQKVRAGERLNKRIAKLKFGSVSCSSCGKRFLSNPSLAFHVRRYHSSPNNNSSEAPRDTTKPLKTNVKKKSVAKRKPKVSHPCSVCGKLFYDLRTRMVHEINICGVPYDEEKLKQAMKMNGCRTDVIVAKCTYPGCAMVCYKHLLERHLRVHTREQPHQCQHCGKSFSQEGTRKQHELTVCAPDPAFVAKKKRRSTKPKVGHPCYVCGKLFNDIRDRMAHEFNVCGVPYSEDKSGNDKSGLTKCTYPGCNLICYKKLLKRHLCTHTGELPFQCSHCGKSFSQNSTRKKHELTVCAPDPAFVAKAAQRSAQCRERKKLNTVPCPHESCQKKFLNDTRLNVHLQRHHGKGHDTTAATSICDTCGKSFPCSTSLRMHVKRVHERFVTNYSCILKSSTGCQERFTCLKERKRHMTVVHGK